MPRGKAATEGYQGVPRRRYHVTMIFVETLLGGSPLDPETYAEYIATRAPEGTDTGDEVAAAENAANAQEDDEMTRGVTGFLRVEIDGKQQPVLPAWAIKGMFKEKCGALRIVDGTYSAKLVAYKGRIDQSVEVTPRFIPLVQPEDATGDHLMILERTLRAETMRGPRVAIARSETLPPGTSCEFDVLVTGNDITQPMIQEWLVQGQVHGMGQWRNAGWGTVVCEIQMIGEEYLQPMSMEQAKQLARARRANPNPLIKNPAPLAARPNGGGH